MTYTKAALLEAINHLIVEPNPQYPREALDALTQMRGRYPVKFTGTLAVLNPLLTLRDDDPVAFSRVQHLIDTKRGEAGLPPCWPAEEPEKFDRLAYQRRLMALRRERSGRSLAIENMQREERDKLVGSRRLDYENRQLSAWGEEADRRVAQAKQAAGGKITRDQINAVKQRYFESLEAELDEREAAVRAELLKPAHMRRKL